ncbi:MAG: SRPBCC family protein [Anaerolineae bacterium]|nr:SRPBCC family protein [Anaerolineae bacterium]
MIKNKIQVQINRPVETVFAFVVEPANTVQWLDVVSEAGKTSEGELGVGSVYRQLFRLRGETNQEMFFEISVFEPNQSMAFRRKGGQYPISGVYTFEANGDGTLLTYDEEAGPDKLIPNLIAKLITGRLIRRQLEADFATLKLILEGKTE